MCTVIVDVPAHAGGTTRILAVRDEDPARPWDAPGEWWPSTDPGVRGVRDRRANGAWLAVASDSGRLAVIRNRAEEIVPDPGTILETRGDLVLASVSGHSVPDHPRTAAFNLVEVAGSRVTVTSWDGTAVRRIELSPGVHMIAHHDLDDPRTARNSRWLPEFAEQSRTELGSLSQSAWHERWIGVLARSAELGPADDESIIRDNRAHGYPTLSLLTCLAEVSADAVSLESAALPTPGAWSDPTFSAS